MVRRAQTKTTALLHKSHYLWKAGGEAQAGGEGVRRGKRKESKCDREDKKKRVEPYFWFGLCQLLYCQYLKIITH